MTSAVDNNKQPARVDFYLLQGTNNHTIQLFCCRLAEKAWKLGNTVFVRTENEQQAQYIDNLMWTYSDGSFLPHVCEFNHSLNNESVPETPVIIGTDNQHQNNFDLMINLANDTPDSCKYYTRIAEVLNEEPAIKAQGRKRYVQYDKNNHPLNHHNIDT